MGGAAGGGLGLCALPHVPGAAGTGTGAARRLRAASGVCAGSLCAWQGGWVWLGKSLPTPSPFSVCAALPASRSVTLPVLVLGEGDDAPSWGDSEPSGEETQLLPLPAVQIFPYTSHSPFLSPMPLFWGAHCSSEREWGDPWGPADAPEASLWPGSSWRNLFLACPASHPLWPPRASEGGVPLRKAGRGVPWQEGKWKEKLGSTRAGGQAGGLRAPRAGGSNPSPLVCGAGVSVGGVDPPLLRVGAAGSFPRGKPWSPGGP